MTSRQGLSWAARSRDWWTTGRRLVLGPWPLRPAWLALVAFTVVTASSTLTDLEPWITGQERFPWFSEAPRAIAVAAVLTLPLVLLEVVRTRVMRRPLSRLWYFLVIGVTAVWGGFLTLVLYLPMPWSAAEAPWAIAAPTFRIFAVQVVLYGALGISQQRLVDAARRADEANIQLRSQKELLLLTEEKGRRAVADFLHDRVQSVLVVSTMELGRIADEVDEPARSRLRSIAEQLDEVRSMEVREASTRLSPNIGTVGLEGSLAMLAESVAPTGVVAIRLDPSLADWASPGGTVDTCHIATYRIIEQALGNAIVHGGATRVEVAIERADGALCLTIDDDGQGLPAGPMVPGSGTAVIDSWCSALEGRWTLQASPLGGARLQAVLPLAADGH